MPHLGRVLARTIAATTACALLASTAPALAQPADEVVNPTQTQPVQQVDGKMDPVAPLSISVLQEEPARAGGLGQVKIPLIRRTDTGPALRGITALVRVPRSVRLTAVTGKGWRCATDKTTATCRTPSLARTANPAPLFATFSVRKAYPKKRVRVSADATWQGGPVKARKGARWLVTGSGTVPVSKPLRLKLTSANGDHIVLATNGPDTSRQVGLQAVIGNIDGAQVSARWRQTRGPKVRMLLPRQLDHITDRVSQVAQIPDSLGRDATLGFRLIISGNGQRVTRGIQVRALVHRLDRTSAARDHLYADLASATRKPVKTIAHRLNPSNGLRLVTRTWQVQPGTRVTVRAQTKRKVRTVQWFVGERAAGSGPKLRLRASTTPATPRLIAAVVTLRNGKVLQESATLVSTSPGPNTGGGLSAQNEDALCQYAKEVDSAGGQVDIALATGQRLLIKKGGASVDKPLLSRTCNAKWSISVTDAQITHPAGKLTDVKAKITADAGLQLTAASLVLPEKLQVGSTTKVSLAPTGDTGVRAPLVNGQFELLEGSLAIQPIQVTPTTKVNGLAWVPLPDDWSFSPNASVVSFINASPDDDRLKDNTLRIAQTASGPQDASMSLSADSTDSTWNRIEVTAANIGLGATANGDTLMAAGTGALIVGDTGSSLDLDITCVKDGSPDADCQLFDGFVMKDFAVKLSREVFGLYGDAGIRYGQGQVFEFAVVGAYKSVKDWDLKGRTTTVWELPGGMSLSDIAGSVSMSPVTKDKSDLKLEVTGTLNGFRLSDSATLNSLTTTISNRCPETAQACKTNAVNFAISANLTIQGPDKPLTLEAGTLLDLANGEFTFDFGLQDMQIGPSELKITKADFTLSNAASNSCTPRGEAPAPASPKVFSVTLRAQAEVFKAEMALRGTLSKAGSCLWGSPGPIDVSKALEAKAGVLAYTSYKNGADLSISGQQAPITVGGNRVQVMGDFDLPGSIMQMFGIPDGSQSPGRLTYLGTYDFAQQGINFELSYTVAAGKEIVMYASDGNREKLTLDAVGFQVAYRKASNQADLKAFAKGTLIMAGGGGVDPSRTPMKVSIGFEIADGVKVTLQAGVITNDKDVAQPIQNAFGQAGLTVNTLTAGLALAAPITSSEFAVNADVLLPGRWVQNIGIKDQTRVGFGLRLAQKNPCLQIRIGEQDVAARTTVVDIANKGFLTAQYFTLLIAPTGCTLPGDTFIPPGYAFAFDGTIVGAPVRVDINAGINDGLTIKGDLQVPSLDLYALKLGGTKPGTPLRIKLDIDSKSQQYKVDFDAGIDIGQPDQGLGARVRVQGGLTIDDQATTLSLKGTTNLTLQAIALAVDPITVNVRFAKSAAAANTNYARVHADMVASVLGLSIRAGGDLAYASEQLQQLRIYAGATIDIEIASVSGTAEFNYCLGKLGNLTQSGSRCTVFRGTQGARPAYRVGFYGDYRILWIRSDYTWVAYDQAGTEGTPPPPPDISPGFIPGLIPPGTPRVLDTTLLTHGVSDLSWRNTEAFRPFEASLKTVGGTPVAGVPACTTARLGTQWRPTQASPNPKVQAVNPDSGDKQCGIVVDWTRVVSGSPAPTPSERSYAVCGPDFCSFVSGSLQGVIGNSLSLVGPSLAQARTALLAGLRTTPGVLPAGSGFVMGAEGIISPDGKHRLSATSSGFDLNGTTRPWRAGQSTASNPMVTGTLLPNGQLQGTRQDGTTFTVGSGISEQRRGTDDIYLLVQDGFRVYQKPKEGLPKVIWGVDSAGNEIGTASSA